MAHETYDNDERWTDGKVGLELGWLRALSRVEGEMAGCRHTGKSLADVLEELRKEAP